VTPTEIDRRKLLVALASAATGAFVPGSLSAQPAKTRLILLGTGGGPRPRKVSSAPAQVIVVNFVPADDPAVTDQMWIDAARTHFRGAVIVGKDLLEV